MAPSSVASTSPAIASKRGAPARAFASSPCTWAAPPTRSPGSDQRRQELLPLAPHDALDAHLDHAVVHWRRARSFSRSTKASGASAMGRSQGGPAGGAVTKPHHAHETRASTTTE